MNESGSFGNGRAGGVGGLRVSVIVPVLNEAGGLPGLLDHMQASLEAGEVHEVIVADGGSTDGGDALVRARAAFRLVRCAAGRALQMNAGAAAARGDVLLFLHADCRLEDRALAELRSVMNHNGIVGGAFRHRIRDRRWFLRLIEFGDNLRSGLLGLFYGDQGIFCRRDVFESLGGWPAMPIMEEYPFSRALKRQGRVRLLRSRVSSSARRWQVVGAVRLTLRNWSLVIRYLAGVSPEALKREYPDIRE